MGTPGQFIEQAMLSGYEQGAQRRQSKKEALSDEEHEQILTDHNNTIATLQTKMAQVGPNDPSYGALQNQLSQTVEDRTRLFHPDTPGGLHRLGKLMWERIHGQQSQPPMETTPTAATAAPALPNTAPVTTPNLPGAPGTTLPTMGGTAVPQMPAVPGVAVKHPVPTPGEMKTRAAQELAWGAPAPPVNPIVQFRDQMKTAFPNISDEDLRKAAEIHAGVIAKPTDRPLLKQFRLADGSVAWLDASKPENLPEGAAAVIGGGGQKIRESIEPDPESATGYSKVSYDPLTGDEYSRQTNVLPTSGLIPKERTTSDPFGNVTTSKTRPVLPRGTAPAAAPPTTAKPSAAEPAPTRPFVIPKTPAEAKQRVQAAQAGRTSAATTPITPLAAPAAQPFVVPRTSAEAKARVQAMQAAIPGRLPLDASGHIPEGVGNAQVREAANQLLDGTDKDKLPAKVRELASAFARQYGWEQGKFSPREQGQIRVAATMLENARNSSALDIFDNSPLISGLKTSALTHPAGRQGFLSSIVTRLAAGTASPQEAEYARLYKQLAGTISGLGPTLRSKGMTEATISRLLTELPDPLTTQSKADAQQRIDRLLNEINVAMQKGTFNESTAGSPTTPPSDVSDEEFLRKVR